MQLLVSGNFERNRMEGRKFFVIFHVLHISSFLTTAASKFIRTRHEYLLKKINFDSIRYISLYIPIYVSIIVEGFFFFMWNAFDINKHFSLQFYYYLYISTTAVFLSQHKCLNPFMDLNIYFHTVKTRGNGKGIDNNRSSIKSLTYA